MWASSAAPFLFSLLLWIHSYFFFPPLKKPSKSEARDSQPREITEFFNRAGSLFRAAEFFLLLFFPWPPPPTRACHLKAGCCVVSLCFSKPIHTNFSILYFSWSVWQKMETLAWENFQTKGKKEFTWAKKETVSSCTNISKHENVNIPQKKRSKSLLSTLKLTEPLRPN